jgi:hypothetical protein
MVTLHHSTSLSRASQHLPFYLYIAFGSPPTPYPYLFFKMSLATVPKLTATMNWCSLGSRLSSLSLNVHLISFIFIAANLELHTDASAVPTTHLSIHSVDSPRTGHEHLIRPTWPHTVPLTCIHRLSPIALVTVALISVQITHKCPPCKHPPIVHCNPLSACNVPAHPTKLSPPCQPTTMANWHLENKSTRLSPKVHFLPNGHHH